MRNPFKKKTVIKNRKISKARFIYIYMIFGSLFGLFYFIASLIYELPKHWAFSFIYIEVIYFCFQIIRKNWKIISLYISDMEQGRFLLHLNEYTHWSEAHKLKVVKWVYLSKKTIRREKYLELLQNNRVLSNDEKKLLKYKVVSCPQQILDGWNKALLIDSLIYAHRNIHVLDDDLRDVLELTDNNISKFNLNTEISKIKTKDYEKLMEIGKRASERLN